MTIKGRYTIVKFVPDRMRFEPINVGLVAEVGDRVLTLMSQDLDPRIRYADPHADLNSLRSTLAKFDAEAYRTESRSAIDTLTGNGFELNNLWFDNPLEINVSSERFEVVVNALYSRLVERNFSIPAGTMRVVGPTFARSVLRRVFADANALGSLVKADVHATGVSGVEWRVDFQYLADSICLIQTATTGLREDLRRSEHAFRAFSALIDTTTEPGVRGILAVDDRPEVNDASAQLARLAQAHGLEFYAGRKGFLTLAQQVSEEAQLLTSTAAPLQEQLIGSFTPSP